jgi:HPt (histidine-containing phosphotransfer) domain-containing protein
MADILDVLEDWGCDIEEGLTRLGGDEEFYETLLSGFLQENGMEELAKGIESGDYVRAFEAAHGLKGDTGNLSLTPLYEAVCSLVEDLRPAYAGESVMAGLADDYARVLALFTEFTEKVGA